MSQVDPGQMNNLWDVGGNDTANSHHNVTTGAPLYPRLNGPGFIPERLQSRLDTLLMVLKSCKGQVCVNPWKTVHPLGNVRSLKDAMDPKYDDFYASQPQISFSECAMGYFPYLEGPQRAISFIPREMT